MEYESIKSFFNVKHQNKDKCMAICPCHSDRQASLSISYDRTKGRTLLYCHAGCNIKDILSRVGLKMQDLFDEAVGKGSGRRNIEAVYKYTDKDGRVLFEKVRFKPKSFSQRRYIDGKPVWGLDAGKYYETYPGSSEFSKKEKSGAMYFDFPGINPVLYNLPGIIKAVKNKETVYIVEGEKDADNLIKLGLAATTTFDGASKSRDNQKWRKEYNEDLKGADIVLIPDNDEAGRSHMENIAMELGSIAKSIKLVELPVPNKEDVSWYLEEGHTLDDLLNLMQNTMCMGTLRQGKEISLLSQVLSDFGNAERVIALYGGNIRYDCTRDKFFIWNGTMWEMDVSNSIYTLAKSTLRRFMSETDVLDAKGDDALESMKSKLKSFAVRSENDSRIRAMVNQLKSQPEIILKECDSDPYLLNLKNGTLDLRTGKLEGHRKSDYITKVVDIEYDEKSAYPNWLGFLDKIFMGDTDTIDFVQRSVGYSLTGSTSVSKVRAQYTRNGIFGVDYMTKTGLKRCEIYHDGFRKNVKAAPDFADVIPQYRKYERRNSLAVKIKRGVCELCGNHSEDIHIHHIKHLKDLSDNTEWERLMKKNMRKSLALCPICNDMIHANKNLSNG